MLFKKMGKVLPFLLLRLFLSARLHQPDANQTPHLLLPLYCQSIYRHSPILPNDNSSQTLEEGSLKKFKAEDDDRVPYSTLAVATPSTLSTTDQHPLVPSLDLSRPVAADRSNSEQTVDSDMNVPTSLPHAPSATNVLPNPPAPTAAVTAVVLTPESRIPDNIEVSKVSRLRFFGSFWSKSRWCVGAGMIVNVEGSWVNKADLCVYTLPCRVFIVATSYN